MRKSILLAALVVSVLFAPVTFAKGGKTQQNPKEKTAKAAKVEKKEAKNEQKVADNSKKHHHKKTKKAA
jgi:Ni/Co efflux regulator RcnB